MQERQTGNVMSAVTLSAMRTMNVHHWLGMIGRMGDKNSLSFLTTDAKTAKHGVETVDSNFLKQSDNP